MTQKVETRAALVEHLFHGTGSTYARWVHIATYGRDAAWKEDLLGLLRSPRRVLDLASGTGILSLEIAQRFRCHVTGVELREEYCQEARDEAVRRGIQDVRFIVSPAEHFQIDEEFDHITTCYLPKYVSERGVLVEHLVKMLAPGGRILMQDFAYPKNRAVQKIFEQHFERMRKRAENEAPDWMTMFTDLPEVIRQSTWIDDLVREFGRHGLQNIEVVEQSWGLSAMVVAEKPAAHQPEG
jgi:demethylmenaquinone methyltransferase/2-methoxy-6-polyprenyl-1,4-benzoquinol methylase